MFAKLQAVLNRDFPRSDHWEVYQGRIVRPRLSVQYGMDVLTMLVVAILIWLALSAAGTIIIHTLNRRSRLRAAATWQTEAERFALRADAAAIDAKRGAVQASA